MKINAKWAILTAVALGAGVLIGRGCAGPTDSAPRQPGQAGSAAAEVKFWTCSMHPQIQQPGPGQCPLCAMDLIPVTEGDGDDPLGPRELKLSPAAEALARVEVAPVQRRFVWHELRMAGKVDYDETRMANITAWIPGRLDRLYVDYAGIEVREGDHLVYLYSPELLAAQEELIQAARMVENLRPNGGSLLREQAEATLAASREKLRLWGLTEPQIQEIEARGAPEDHITIYSPIRGVVIRKNALEGEYVHTGSTIYTVADLSRVWIKFDAYESDLAWLHYGQEVEFTTEAYAGEVFRGKIAFIDPVLNPQTRTVKVRVNVDNPEGKLKPEMFVRGRVKSRVARGGKVYAPALAGKWISPMHPEIVKDQPGECDVCGMPLVSAESLGYVLDEEREAPLVIPATAPLMTGKRAVVYVRDPDREGVYEGREIVLGPKAGDYYIVQAGLRQGELVVHQGNFKIDSAMQIMAKPSMMNPQGGGPAPGHPHGDHGEGPDAGGHTPAGHAHGHGTEPPALSAPPPFQRQLAEVFDAYQAVAAAMAADEPDNVERSAKRLLSQLGQLDLSQLDDPADTAWMQQRERLRKNAEDLVTEDLNDMRIAFSHLTEALTASIQSFGLGRDAPIYVHHCPMAFDGEGGSWLQADDQTRNPYFSGGMLRCGGVVKEIGGGGE